MTPAQLDSIESALGLKLPESYRKASIEFTSDPTGGDFTDWFFNNPDQVIWETLSPLQGAVGDRADWKPGFVAIGRSAAGDVFLLDTSEEDSPVYCLLHETHAIEVEHGSLDEFFREWLQSSPVDDSAQLQQRAFWRRWRMIMGIVLLFLLLFGVLPIVLAQWLKPA